MKKIVIVIPIIALVLSSSIASCGQDEEEATYGANIRPDSIDFMYNGYKPIGGKSGAHRTPAKDSLRVNE